MDSEDDGVLAIWNNLPGTAKGVSIAGILLYVCTFALAFWLQGLPWYIMAGLLFWPLIVIAWLLLIAVAFAVFSVSALLTNDKSMYRKKLVERVVKTVVFIPTVIGTALTLVDAFASDIFE